LSSFLFAGPGGQARSSRKGSKVGEEERAEEARRGEEIAGRNEEALVNEPETWCSHIVAVPSISRHDECVDSEHALWTRDGVEAGSGRTRYHRERLLHTATVESIQTLTQWH
jgi:hypothetical protein